MMYIDGRWVNAVSGTTFSAYNPSNGEKIGEAADGDQNDAGQAIEAAHRAFGFWSNLTAYQRSEYLYSAFQLMMEQKENLARVMTEEQGKPLKAAMGEVQYGADFLRWYAEEAKRVYGETIPAPRSDQRFIVMRQPVGVVAAITINRLELPHVHDYQKSRPGSGCRMYCGVETGGINPFVCR